MTTLSVLLVSSYLRAANSPTTITLAVAVDEKTTTVSSTPPLELPEASKPAGQTLVELTPHFSDEEWEAHAGRLTQRTEEAAKNPILQYSSSSDQIAFRANMKAAKDMRLLVPLAVPASKFLRATWDELEGGSAETTDSVSQPSVAFTEVGYVRNIRIGRTTINVAGMPAAQTGITSGVVRLYFENPETTSAIDDVTTGVLRSLIDKLVANPQDINKFTENAASVPGATSTDSWVPGISAKSPFWLKIPVRENGIYKLTGSQIAAVAPQIKSISAQSLHLSLEGREQPLAYFPADEKQPLSVIKPDDRFLFYGAQNQSEHSAVNHYWLYADNTKARPDLYARGADSQTTVVEPASFFPDKVLVEEDNQVVTKNDQFLTILDYRWVWKELTTGTAITGHFSVEGAPRMERHLPGKVVLYVSSYPTGKNFALSVRINGRELPDMMIADARDTELSFRIPFTSLLPTSNTVSVQLRDVVSTAPAATATASSAEIYLDRIEIGYPHTYTATKRPFAFSSPSPSLDGDPVLPLTERNVDYRISGLRGSFRGAVFNVSDKDPRIVKATIHPGRRFSEGATIAFQEFESTAQKYLLSSIDAGLTVSLQAVQDRPDLRSAENQADYLIIAHRTFVSAIAPFAEVKAATGFAVKVIDVEDIYNQFSAGQENPDAIRHFIRYAAQHWHGSARNAAATYVLFVGDCTSAYRDQFRNNIVNYVPSYTVGQPGTSDRYASDSWFACGFGTDWLPDALLGRFSVNNIKDLETLLEKQFTYRTRPATGPWRNLLTYIGDHSEFEDALERVMRTSVPNRFFVNRILMAEEPWVDNYYFPAEIADAKKAKVSPATTRKIRDMFNSGAAMVTYFGHGSPNVWSNERIWFGGDSENSDNLMLTNRDKLPLVMTMTCNTGAIDYPKERWNVCITEDMMRLRNGGAVACYVPSGPGITSQHERYTTEMNRALLGEFIRPVQAAFTLGMWRYVAMDNPLDLPRMFLLLGDPSLELLLPIPETGSVTATAAESGTQHFLNIPSRASGAYYQLAVEDPEFATSRIKSAPPNENSITVSATSIASEGSYHASVYLPGKTDRSLVIPLNKIPFLKADSVNRTPAGVIRAGETVTIDLQIRNMTSSAIRAAKLGLIDHRGDVVETSVISLLPHQVGTASCKIAANPGINRFYVVQFSGDDAVKIEGDDVVFAAAAGESNDESTSPPALIDPQSIEVAYHAYAAGAMTGSIKGKAHSISDVSVLNLIANLVDAQGKAITNAPVPPIAPGASSAFAIRFEQLATTGNMFVQLSTSDGKTTFAQTRIPVEIGPSQFSDIVLSKVQPHNDSPADGETVFFDVTVQNMGQSRVENVRVEGFDGLTSSGPRLESRVSQNPIITSLEPQSSATLKLRWDPFRNAGQRQLLFAATASGGFPETDYENNSTTIPLRVRTKYNLHPLEMVPKVTPEDRRLLQVQFTARVENRGESPAHGVKVVFYPTQDRRDPKSAIGEAIIEEIPPMSIGEATIVYKLKPGEEKREFRPSFRAFLKGSLQRVSMPGLD